MNLVILLGNLTKDVELFNSKDTAVGRTSIAVNNRRDNTTMFIDLVFFGRLAEVANQYLSKGSKISIQGRLDLYNYTDKNGNSRYKHSVICSELEMLDSKPSTPKPQTFPEVEYSENITANFDISEDEIPF